jgi:hypothetical protein
VTADEPYYRHDLALVHHRGFGHHADRCAPGILDLLRPDEVHVNVLVDRARAAPLLAAEDIDVAVRTAFGAEALPSGLRAIVGVRPA